MKVYRLPKECTALIFDLDSTLYTDECYAQSQIDLPIEKLARMQGKTFGRMSEEISAFRKKWSDEHGGQSVSLANVFLSFGISISESVRWREELCVPEKYLAADPQLRSALEQLASRFTLSVVSNNPASVAARTLRTLGVEDLFRAVIGLDTFGVSKPHEEPFMRAAALCTAAPESCISVGDRYDIDIALPLELGMGGILVDGVKDVYILPDLLAKGG